MSRNIKITEEQYKMLQEMEDESYSYVSEDSLPNYDGNKNVTANGKENPYEPGDNTTGDMIQQELTPQSWNRYRMYGNITGGYSYSAPIPTMIREMNGDVNDADDFDETNGFDCVAKLKEQVQIPKLTQEKLALFLETTKGLNVKQQAVILYDLINEFTSQSTSHQARKVFDSLLREFQKRTGLSRTIEKELENAD